MFSPLLDGRHTTEIWFQVSSSSAMPVANFWPFQMMLRSPDTNSGGHGVTVSRHLTSLMMANVWLVA